MAKHDRKKEFVIGDSGLYEKKDMMSLVTIVISNIMVVVLIYLAIRAYMG